MDNDILPPEGYLQNLIDIVNKGSNIGFIGYYTGREMKEGGEEVQDVRHIGGVGLFKTSAIKHLGGVKQSILPSEARFHGFTALQENSKFRKCWVKDGWVKDLSLINEEKQNKYVEIGYTRPVVK